MPRLRLAGGTAHRVFGLTGVGTGRTGGSGTGPSVRNGSSAWQTGGVSSDDPTPADDSPFRDEPTVRDEARQFVLPLVVHIEKAAPRRAPTRWRPPPGPC